VEKEAPCRRLRVDAVGDALEMYLPGFKVIDQVYQSFNAAPEPIQFPHRKGVGFAQLGQSLIESRTPDLRAAEFVSVKMRLHPVFSSASSCTSRFCELLTSAQREVLLAFPTEEAELLRHYKRLAGHTCAAMKGLIEEGE
jgi:hypothetical protein